MNLFDLFESSTRQYAQNIALVVDGKNSTYGSLNKKARQIARLLKKCQGQQVGIFASRSLPAYAGILGTLAAGKTYVALNKKFSVVRNRMIVELGDIKTFIVDREGIEQVRKLGDLDPETVLIAPDLQGEDIPFELRERIKVHTMERLAEPVSEIADIQSDDIAYIIFTSGSTGKPKGVPVSHGNVLSYITYVKERYDVGPTDRFSQVSDLTFDASVHDMFLAWRVGAPLYVVPEDVLMAPAKFIKENKLTTWFSIPSLVQFMERFKMLKPNVFPDMRYSLFGGESLPKSLVLAWRRAAPNSIIENQYGASEITVGLSHYRVPREEDAILQYNGVVSLGDIFSTQNYCLIDENGERVENKGEICLTGSQITSGYWKNENQTAEQYFRFPDDERLWYKTGDILQCEHGNLFYVSRKDHQIKVRGFRIESEEINLAIKNFVKCDWAYTMAYPIKDGLADNIYSFVDTNVEMDKTAILIHLKKNLPEYMVPKDILFIDKIPLNSNGKIDRERLTDQIKWYEK